MEEKITQAVDRRIEVTEKATSFLEQFLTYFLLLLMIVGLGFVTFFNIVKKGGLTQDMLLSISILVLANVGGFVLFNPKGKELEAERNMSYKANSKLWSSYSTSVQDNKSKEFRDYCKLRTDEKRYDKVKSYHTKAGFNEEEFEKDIKPLSEVEFQKLMNSKDEYGEKNYSKKQKRLLAKARDIRNIKVKRIYAEIILLGNTTSTKYEVGTQEKMSIDKQIFLKRVLRVIGSSIIFSLAMIVPGNTIGWALVGEYLLRVSNILMSSVSGLFAGVYYIKARNDRIKGNIWFLKEFAKESSLEIKE